MFRSCIFLLMSNLLLYAASFNSFGLKEYTIESEHFRLHYQEGLKHVADEIADILERLYGIYRNVYRITLPSKTEVVVTNEYGNGGALPLLNTIVIDANAFDFNMRGSADWLENVVAHEYAHIVSIWTSFKSPSWIPYYMYGFFTHPNEKRRLELLHVFPNDILPPWLFEGIAQYESSRNKGDSWDTHRDMVLRTLSLSNKLLTWDHMSVFAGRGDDYEKTYNHGFSLVKYIAETYGYDVVLSILREASKFPRINFDRSIKAVMGISGRELYDEWKTALKKRYTRQIDSIGPQVYGTRINKDGYNNYLPRFGPGDEKIYFLSNGTYEYYRQKLFSYSMADTVDKDKRIIMETPAIASFYDIYDPAEKIVFTSAKSRKSQLKPSRGGQRTRDIFINDLPDRAADKRYRSRKERQISEKKDFFHAVFSPDGKRIACTKRQNDKFIIYLTDTAGSDFTPLYPSKKHPELDIHTIFSIDWSPDSNCIAIGYIDRNDRKIGIFNLKTKEFYNVCDTRYDERDPRFSPDGKKLYFSSDRSGIFNIYRFNFEKNTLQRLTNVSGGAFTPDVSNDETKLVFANYDENGYGIYLIDSIQVLEEKSFDTATCRIRLGYPAKKLLTRTSSPGKYSSLPREFLFVPAFIGEQVLTENNDVYKGITNFKIGFIAYLFDPLDIVSNRGNSITAFFLYDPSEFLFDKKHIINKKATYDLALFAHSSRLPFDLDFSFYQRSIAGKDYFNIFEENSSNNNASLDYKLCPNWFTLSLTHKLFGNFRSSYSHAGIHGEYDLYRVWVKMESDTFEVYNKYFGYTPTKGYRVGAHYTLSLRKVDPRSSISPKGLGLMVGYDFYNQYMQNEVNSFTFEDGTLKENYHAPYRYNQVDLKLLYGRSVPLLKKHNLFFKLDASLAKLTKSSKNRLKEDVESGDLPHNDIPGYMQPWLWVPGYTFYFKDEENIDTILISGNGVAGADLSYRFPLWPGSIDRKWGFLYLDKFYGAINFGGGVAVNRLSDFFDLHRQDLFLYRGIELRLETISFNTMPMAISFRWDYGIDKAPPLGGHRLSCNIGFDFDYWDIVVEPRRHRFGSQRIMYK